MPGGVRSCSWNSVPVLTAGPADPGLAQQDFLCPQMDLKPALVKPINACRLEPSERQISKDWGNYRGG